ncbi:hypothetical protein NDA16_004890 [Ustilago loliicola]|nr:hypothetical protein NDA16_004890 [Ustilago loliicola]
MTQPLQAQALVVEEAHGPFKVADIELDLDKLKSDEVIVRYRHTGVCIATPELLPAIYGHEGAGTVEHLSSTYKGPLKVGDSVLASFCSCDLASFTKEMQQVKVPYKSQDGSQGEALIKYFGQSSFSSRMAVTDRSTGFATVFEKAPSDQPRSFDLFESAGIAVPSSAKSSSRHERSKQTLLVTGLGGVGLGALYGGNSLPEVTFPYLVSKLEASELKFLEKMVEVYKPADMNKAIEDQESGKVIKPVIEWV